MSFHRLTPRQREVADLVLAGRSVVAVARELGMPIATARSHIRDIARRLSNPFGLPAVSLIRSYAAVAIAASTDAVPSGKTPAETPGAAAYWAGAAARRATGR